MNAEQTEIITIIPRVSASVSLACSSFVMLDVSGVLSRVICDQTLRKSKLNRVQPRLVFFMCMADFFASLMFVLGDVVFPTEYGGKGNIATCNAGGWFIQMIPATALYNAFLALYYLLTIRYKKTEKQMVKFELWSHILIAIFWIGSGTVGVVLGLFNPALFDCWIFGEPAFCGSPELPCNRPYYGVSSISAQYYLYYVWIYASFVISGVSMFMVYWTVYEQEKKQAKWNEASKRKSSLSSETNTSGNLPSFTETDPVPQNSTVTQNSTLTQTSTQRNEIYKRSRRVATQGIFYVGAFYATWFIPTVNQIYSNVTGSLSPFPLFCLSMAFIPLQGFFNFLVYLRPRMIRWYDKRRKRIARAAEGNSLAYLPPRQGLLTSRRLSRRRSSALDSQIVSEDSAGDEE